jgi:LPS export ABC transporter protein LptC
MINLIRKYYCGTNRQLYLVRIFILGAFFCTITACKNDPEEIRALTGRGSNQEDHAEDVTFIYSKEGQIKMRVSAHEFVRNESAKPPYIDMSGNLKVDFYDSSGNVDNVLTADSCRYYEAQGNVLVWDSVQIVSSKGQKLNTSELVWNQSAQKFFTEKAVRIATPTEVLYGDGMEANSDFSWYQITKPKGTVEVKKGEVPQ